ncbi:hypothetical protein M758_7G038000, partial [Ceratodon purpureus]
MERDVRSASQSVAAVVVVVLALMPQVISSSRSASLQRALRRLSPGSRLQLVAHSLTRPLSLSPFSFPLARSLSLSRPLSLSLSLSLSSRRAPLSPCEWISFAC